MSILLQLGRGTSLRVIQHPPVPAERTSVYAARVEIYRETWNDFVALVGRSYSDARALLTKMKSLHSEASKRVKDVRAEAEQIEKAVAFYKRCEKRFGKDAPIDREVQFDKFDVWQLAAVESRQGRWSSEEELSGAKYELVMPALTPPIIRIGSARYTTIYEGDTFTSKRQEAELDLMLAQAVAGGELRRHEMLEFRIDVFQNVMELYEVYGVLEDWGTVMRPYERFLASDRETGPDPLSDEDVEFVDGREVHLPFVEVLVARLQYEHKYLRKRKMKAAALVCEWHNEHHGPIIRRKLGKEADLTPKRLLDMLKDKM